MAQERFALPTPPHDPRGCMRARETSNQEPAVMNPVGLLPRVHFRKRHRVSVVEGVRRAWMQRNWHKLAEYAAAAVMLIAVLVVPVGWGWSYAFAGSEAPPAPTAVTCSPPR